MRDLRNTRPFKIGKVVGLFLEDKSVPDLEVDLEGIVGCRHRGFTRTLGKHDGDYLGRGFNRGYEVSHDRHWSAVSLEDMNAITDALGVGVMPLDTLRANVIFEGLGHLWHYPAGSTFVFERGAAFEVSRKNSPCNGVGNRLDRVFPNCSISSRFVAAATPYRGLLGRIWHHGEIKEGDVVSAYMPIVV